MTPRRTILVVEDDALIADAVAARLRAEGFTVELAVDGPTGVRACERLQPALVVLDVMLPGFDGWEVCRRIQSARPVPVLMLTARDSETDLLVGLDIESIIWLESFLRNYPGVVVIVSHDKMFLDNVTNRTI
ncbi:MAG: response regulator, partial [Baekduiaceae bacterium]